MPAPSTLSLAAPTPANCAAVVVLFHPEGDLVGRLGRVLQQVARLAVVSNDGLGAGRLAGLDPAKVWHHAAGRNIGLAAALNEGLAEAARRGFAWCLLLDQDSVVDEDLVAGLGQTWAACPERASIGALVPNYRSPGQGRLAYPPQPAWQSVPTAVTSGSLVALAAIRRVGGMRDAFFIEGIDLEFSLRLRAAGLQLVASGRPLMTHGAGAAEEHRLFGRTVLVGHHPPARCFLQLRNLTWTLWRYGRREPQWTRTTLLAILKRVCLVLLFERQRARKLWAMLRGAWVGTAQALRPDTAAPRLQALE
jgi:rhamnosyltransferase